jgi:multiple sugar transport system substrate-binding protein
VKFKGILNLFVTVLLVIVVSGCSLFDGDNKGAAAQSDAQKETTIKVMFYDEQYFMQRYGNLFIAKNPNINIEVVSMRNMHNDPNQDPKTVYSQFIETEQPDVLMLPPDELEKLAADQQLYDLEPLIAQDKFDIENIHPTIIEYLKMKGGGKLYGLSPTFSNDALLINRDLFTKHGVELPEGKMNWQDVLMLAQRFPGGADTSDRIYGYSEAMYRNDPFSLIMRIADDTGLTLENEGKSAILTPSWKVLFEQVIAAYKKGAIVRENKENDPNKAFSREEWLLQDPFVAGKSAMTVGDSYALGTLMDAANLLKDRSFNWEIINAPVGDNADQVTNFGLNEIFAINAKSNNTKAAWELVKYINGDEIARVYSKTQSHLWSRTTYMNLKDGKSLEPFYQLTFNRNETARNEFAHVEFTISGTSNQEIEEVIADRKTLDQALEAIDKQLQTELDNIKTSQDKSVK